MKIPYFIDPNHCICLIFKHLQLGMKNVKDKPKTIGSKIKIVSLSDWPRQPFCFKNNKLSPKTYQILKESRVPAQEIVPKTFEEFLMTLSEAERQFSDVHDLFARQNHRRIKKVSILKEIWKKQSNSLTKTASITKQSSKSQKHHRSFNLIFTPVRAAQFQRLRENSMRTLNAFNKPSPYSDYYSGRQLKTRKKQFFCDQSTRSRRNTNEYQMKTKKKVVNKKKKTITEPQTSKQDKVVDILNELMARWSQIEKQHEAEQEYLRSHPEFSSRERGRLKKIQNIEIEQIKYEIKSIKEKMCVARDLSERVR